LAEVGAVTVVGGNHVHPIYEGMTKGDGAPRAWAWIRRAK
jgi:hypothetical protein